MQQLKSSKWTIIKSKQLQKKAKEGLLEALVRKDLSKFEKVLTIHNQARQTRKIGLQSGPIITQIYSDYLKDAQFSDLEKILNASITKDVDILYMASYTLLLQHYLKHELSNAQVAELFVKTQNAFQFLSTSMDERKISLETQQMLKQAFLDLSSKLAKFQQNNYTAICRIMRSHRIYNFTLLDTINTYTLMNYKSMPFDILIIYLQTLVRAGNQFHPETIYYLRDKTQINELPIDIAFDFFDILVRSRLNLMNPLLVRLRDRIIAEFDLLESYDQIMFAFQLSKTALFDGNGQIFYKISSNLKKANPVMFKMYLLALCNVDFKNVDYFKDLQCKVDLSKKISEMKGTFSEKEQKYFQTICTM